MSDFEIDKTVGILDGKILRVFTVDELITMCREFSVQTYLGENSNDEAWMELYLKKHEEKA